jgi:hypothetical protein
MKSKKNIKIVIRVVSLVILILAAGCSNTNKNSGNEQSGATSGNSQNNKSSDAAAAPNTTTSNATLNGIVTKIEGNKITISKTTQKSNGIIVGHKNGSPAATNDIGIFEVNNDTTVIVRTVSDKGINYADTAGSISEIKVDSFVSIWGEKEGDTVTATKVIVSIFEAY